MMESLGELVWRQPEWLWLALYPWLLWTVRGLMRRPRGSGYADPGLAPWAQADAAGRYLPRRLWRHGALALAWLLLAAAMAGPRLLEARHGQEQEQYAQLMIVLDLSRSMTARDVVPSRLERAKLELDDLITRAEQLKIGLVVYAARPHLMVPPTHDHAAVRRYIKLLRHGLLPTEGSDLQAAIELAAGRFTSDRPPRALLLVTDGEVANEGATAYKRLEETAIGLAQRSIPLHALGIGTSEGASLLTEEGQWLRHQDEMVISRLHEERLRTLTGLANGDYAPVSDTDAEWHTLYDRNIRQLEREAGSGRAEGLASWRELYGWFLLPGTLLLLLAGLEPRRRSLPAPAGLLLLAAVSLLGGTPQPAHASPMERAYEAYSNESWLEAQQQYARVPGYAGRMGEGASAYQAGKFREAVKLFTQAALDADSDVQRARALFNLANSHYRLEEYAAAINLYQEVMRYDPDNGGAQSNLELAVMMSERQVNSGAGGAGRPGRGPRGTRKAQGNEVSGDLTLGESEEVVISEPGTSANLTSAESDRITRSIHQSRTADPRHEEFDDTQWRYAATSEARVARLADRLEMDESLLWKRIFEAEEGFPGHVETPYELPGVPPW